MVNVRISEILRSHFIHQLVKCVRVNPLAMLVNPDQDPVAFLVLLGPMGNLLFQLVVDQLHLELSFFELEVVMG